MKQTGEMSLAGLKSAKTAAGKEIDASTTFDDGQGRIGEYGEDVIGEEGAVQSQVQFSD